MSAHAAAEGFYALQAKTIEGKSLPLTPFAGKVTLVVNTASECGFTPQYQGLQEIYEKYKGKGFEILAFPSNDFGGQEPGSNTEVKKFCELKYRTTFPLFEKGPVKGPEKQPVYKWLTETGNPELKGEVGWNFEKFLIDRQGKIVARYKSKVKPTDEELTSKIEALLR